MPKLDAKQFIKNYTKPIKEREQPKIEARKTAQLFKPGVMIEPGVAGRTLDSVYTSREPVREATPTPVQKKETLKDKIISVGKSVVNSIVTGIKEKPLSALSFRPSVTSVTQKIADPVTSGARKFIGQKIKEDVERSPVERFKYNVSIPLRVTKSIGDFFADKEEDLDEETISRLDKSGVALSKYGDVITKNRKTGEIRTLDALGAIGTAEKIKTGAGKLKKIIAKNLDGVDIAPGIKKFIADDVVEKIGEKSDPVLLKAYIDENIKKREMARKVETGGFKDKISNVYKTIKRKVVESQAPIEDILNEAERKGKFTIRPESDYRLQTDRVLRAQTLAAQHFKKSEMADVIKDAKDLDVLEQYLIAKQSRAVEARGFKTGRDLEKDKELIEYFAPEYEQHAKKVADYARGLLDIAVEGGLISKELADKLKKIYPDYVPINRILNELEQEGSQFGTKAVGSLSSQNIVQKLQGSEREIENPILSLASKTNDVFRQVEKNKAAQMLKKYKDLPGNPFDLRLLVDSEKVTARKNVLQKLKELGKKNRETRRNIPSIKKAEGKMAKEIKSIGLKNEEKSISNLKKELSRTEKEMESLFDEASTRASDFDTKSNINNLLSKAETRERKIFKLNSDLNETISKFNKKRADKIKIKSSEINDLKNIRRELEKELADRVKTVKDLRGSLRNLSDIKSELGKDTISLYTNGIKEVLEAPKHIARAAKNLDVDQFNILTKILAAPVRVAKIGITGLNAAFILANVVRDQILSAITSRNSFRTSVANPSVFAKSLYEAIGHGEGYNKFVKAGAGGTSFDIARGQEKAAVSKLRAKRNIAERAKYIVKNPGDLFRALEDIVGRSEELTRLQQFNGTKQAMLKQGANEKTATLLAAKAARENTANFYRSGEWGKVLNGAFLYLNASIQGSRALVRSFRRSPKATAAKIAATLYTPIAIATAWNTRDDEKKKVYNDIAEYEKDNNLIIIPDNVTQDENGKWNIIKIPLPPGVSQLAIPLRRMIEGEDDKKILSSIINSVSPVDTDKPLASAMPQAVKPFSQYASNYDFFTGYATVPKGMENLSPEQQAFKNTSGTARLISGKLGLSPIKTEKFIKDTFGELGLNMLNVSDRALVGLDIIPEEQVGGRSFNESIVRRFTKASGGELNKESEDKLTKILQESADESYRLGLEAEAIYEDLKTLKSKDEMNAKAAAIKKSNPELYDKLKNTVENEKLGLSYEERLIKRLPVNDGTRAKFIYEKLNGMEDKKQKNGYVNEMKKKKIISDKVYAQLRLLISGQSIE